MTEFVTFLSFGFVQRALIAGLVLAVLASMLGVFVLMRRMSFFSDAMAHASLLGVAISLLLVMNPVIGAVIGSLLVSLLIAFLIRQRTLSADTIIGVVFSSSVALAIFLMSTFQRSPVDLTSLLFGDLLAVSTVDVVLALILFVLTAFFVKFYTKPMLIAGFHKDLAKLEYKRTELIEALFLALLAFVIAVSLKMAGAILVSALIIIPAAAAQNMAKNIRQMFLASVLIGAVSVVLGMYFSFVFDSPSGSTIVLVASMFFLLSLLVRSK